MSPLCCLLGVSVLPDGQHAWIHQPASESSEDSEGPVSLQGHEGEPGTHTDTDSAEQDVGVLFC